MQHTADQPPQETAGQRWQRRMAAQPVPPLQTTSGFPVAPLYSPADIGHLDYKRRLPG